MSSAAVLLLAKEVAGLATIPAGPERAAACGRPRRRSWDALASIQRSVRPLSTDEVSELGSWQRERAQEASECCKELREVLGQLQERDRESGASHWASTEYAVLFEEISAQQTAVDRLLGRPEDSASGEEPAKDEADTPLSPCAPSTSNGQCTTIDTTGSTDSLLEYFEVQVPSHGDASPARRAEAVGQGSKEVRVPVRLRVEDLEDLDDYNSCEWAAGGICNKGCTVGGCRAHMVEAW